MCFSLKCFSELCKFCCSAGILPAIVYTNGHRGETERGQSPEYIFKSWKTHAISNEHPVHRSICYDYVGKEWCYEFWQKFCRPRCFNRRTQGWTDKVLIRRCCLASRNEYASTGCKAKILPRIFFIYSLASSSTGLLLVLQEIAIQTAVSTHSDLL